jgi:hypothetical protein
VHIGVAGALGLLTEAVELVDVADMPNPEREPSETLHSGLGSAE